MPELPEVETVKNGLIKKVLNKKITNCKIIYEGIIAYPQKEEFIKNNIESSLSDYSLLLYLYCIFLEGVTFVSFNILVKA